MDITKGCGQDRQTDRQINSKVLAEDEDHMGMWTYKTDKQEVVGEDEYHQLGMWTDIYIDTWRTAARVISLSGRDKLWIRLD